MADKALSTIDSRPPTIPYMPRSEASLTVPSNVSSITAATNETDTRLISTQPDPTSSVPLSPPLTRGQSPVDDTKHVTTSLAIAILRFLV